MSQANHGECALLMPNAYQGEVTSSHDDSKTWSIIEAATFYDIPPIVDRVEDWAICVDGLYCLTMSYPISAERLDEKDWEEHMSEKSWVNRGHFAAALSRARTLRDLGYIR